MMRLQQGMGFQGHVEGSAEGSTRGPNIVTSAMGGIITIEDTSDEEDEEREEEYDITTAEHLLLSRIGTGRGPWNHRSGNTAPPPRLAVASARTSALSGSGIAGRRETGMGMGMTTQGAVPGRVMRRSGHGGGSQIGSGGSEGSRRRRASGEGGGGGGSVSSNGHGKRGGSSGG